MSLYLKMLEGELPPNWQKEWLENELLPTLDGNILCGNSLIDEASYDAYLLTRRGSLYGEDADVKFRINRFDWTSRTRGFGRILDDWAVVERQRRGFDCIIGNPPYIRVQELNKWAPEECAFYKWRYKSAAKGNYDIYVVFVERALQLLAPGGLLGFIIPHKFWQAAYGGGLRKIIADGKHLRSVVDFTHNTVFRDAAIYTAIHVLSKDKPPHATVSVARIEELIDGPTQVVAAERRAKLPGLEVYDSPHPQDSAPWSLVPPAASHLMSNLAAATPIRLSDVVLRMAQGIRTSHNDVYVLRRVGQRKTRFFSAILGREIDIEPSLLLPFVGAEHMRRYELAPSDYFVLVPYERARSGAFALIESKRLSSRFPATWAYLKQCEDDLRAREGGKMDTEQWYGFIYPKNIEIMRSPKIVVPDVVDRPTFSLDSAGVFAFVSGYGITCQPTYANDMHLLLGLLNSRVLGEFLKSVSTPLRGGWYRPFPQFMQQLPIMFPVTSDNRRLADRITLSVHTIIHAKMKLRDPAGRLSDRQRGQLESAIETYETRIDEAVLRLYDVSCAAVTAGREPTLDSPRTLLGASLEAGGGAHVGATAAVDGGRLPAHPPG